MVKWRLPGSLYFENTRKNSKSDLVLIVVLVLVLVLESKALYSLLLNHVNRMSLVQPWVVLELMVTWITGSKLWLWLMKTCALTAASATWPVMTVVIKPLPLMPRPICLMWLRTVLDVLCAFQFVLLLVSSMKCPVWISQSILLRACLHGGGGPQVNEVTPLGRVTRLSI